MLEKAKKVIRILVGGEFGYFKEGNIQWYYVISMVIADLLIWKINYDVAKPFMLLSVLHFVSLYVFGSFIDEKKPGKVCSIFLLLSHLIIVISAMLIDVSASFFSIIFVIFLTGISSIMLAFSVLQRDSFLPVIFNLLLFIIFLICVITLPILWYEKIIFIVIELIIHPVIDYLQKYIQCVTELVSTAWEKVFK